MGVHTGDSITVAPAMTLTDREYQRMRDIAIAVIRAVGVDTGGCNIQFAVNPHDGRMVVIEMNPRVSRSSALASKATGFPIAKIAAKLAVGYTLDEIPNDITRETPASFEPTLDYVVVKVPRFAFEKFPQADPTLTTTMKSVGEAMAIGRNFAEALQKALRSLERPEAVFHWRGDAAGAGQRRAGGAGGAAARRPAAPSCSRRCAPARRVDELAAATGIDPWFLDQIERHQRGRRRRSPRRAELDRDRCCAGPSGTASPTASSASCASLPEPVVRGVRHALGIRPVYKTVDTCAAEFAATHAVPLLLLRRGDRGRAARATRRCSSSAAGRTGSGRASSSTTPACTRR